MEFSLKKHLQLSAAGMLIAVSVSAQTLWTGEVSADGATNFHTSPQSEKTHVLGDLSGRIGFKTDKVSLTVSGEGSYDHRQTVQTGRTITLNGLADTSRSGDISVKQYTDIHAKGAADFGWTPDGHNSFGAYYSYRYDTGTPNTLTSSTDKVSGTGGVIPLSFSKNTADNFSYLHSGGLRYDHTFEKVGRRLSAKIDATIGHDSDFSEWINGEGEIDKNNFDVSNLRSGTRVTDRYRITPYSDNSSCIANVTFREPEFAGAENLEMDFALNWHVHTVWDHSRASTLVNGFWRDSVSYREDFKFRAATLAPSVRIFYTVGIYKLDLTYTPEYYAHKLDSGEKIGDIEKGTVAHLVDLVNILEPWNGHQFVLDFHRSEERPDYLQVCWFPRASSQYSDELYMGNRDLKNSITTKGSLAYKFSYKRFSSSLTAGYTYMPRKITSTYNNVVDETGKEYRIYTWVNGGTSQEMKGKLSLSWKAARFKAGISGQYTLYHGVSLENEETRSGDWSLSADAEYNLKTWTFSASANYQSDIVRTYVSMTGFPTVDARVNKKFGKHFSVFLEGRNVLEQDITVTTKSEDETETREETYRYNKRLFKLGFSYFL